MMIADGLLLGCSVDVMRVLSSQDSMKHNNTTAQAARAGAPRIDLYLCMVTPLCVELLGAIARHVHAARNLIVGAEHLLLVATEERHARRLPPDHHVSTTLTVVEPQRVTQFV